MPSSADSSSPLPSSLIPAARSRVRVTSEVHGFVLWMGSFAGLAVWYAWAMLPERVLEGWGVTYYPDRSWSVVLPAYFLMFLLFLPLLYLCVNLAHTLPLDDLRTIRDGHTMAQQRRKKKEKEKRRQEEEESRLGSGAEEQEEWNSGEIADIPLERINELLYRRQ